MPEEKKRNQEYAALFVESYYENKKVTRKGLMGEKISTLEMVLNLYPNSTRFNQGAGWEIMKR